MRMSRLTGSNQICRCLSFTWTRRGLTEEVMEIDHVLLRVEVSRSLTRNESSYVMTGLYQADFPRTMIPVL